MHATRRIAALALALNLAPIGIIPQARPHSTKPTAPAPSSIADKLKPILSDPALSHAVIGIAVKGLDGQVVYGYNDGLLFTPASNAKLATTAAAFSLLPVESMTWATTVVANGVIDSQGVLHGDLVLLGSGDPTLSRRTYPYTPPPVAQPAPAVPPTAPTEPPAAQPQDMDVLNALAQQVEQAGVRTVDGSVVGDDSFFLDEPYGEGWAWDDLQWSYGAPISALTFAENTIELKVANDPASPNATVATWNPNVDYYTLENTMTPVAPGQQAHPGVDHRPGSLLVRAWGTIPASGLTVGLAVVDPAEYAATAFKQALMSRGVTVNGAPGALHKTSDDTDSFAKERAQVLHFGPVTSTTIAAALQNRTMLATHMSVPMIQDIVLTNKTSQNLHAELLLRLLGKLFGKDGSFVEGSRVERQFLLDAGLNDADFFFYDGSGMSPDDRIAPRAYAQLLSYASRQSWGNDVERYVSDCGRGRHAFQPLQEFALEGKVVGEDGNAERDECAERVPDGRERQGAGVLDHGECTSAGKRCGSAGN